MSQRKTNKPLSTMEDVAAISDQQLREALKKYNQLPGPITDSTRNLYRKKLVNLIESEIGGKMSSENSTADKPNATKSKAVEPAAIQDDDDDDDSSDEDYVAQEDSSEESSEEESSEDLTDDDDSDEAEEVEEDESIVDDLEEDMKLNNMSAESDVLTTSMVTGSEFFPNRISAGIVGASVMFFMIIAISYLAGGLTNSQKLFERLRLSEITARRILLFTFISLLGYIVYRIRRFYQKRRDQEMKRVCRLVDDALELLQSPDNPQAQMPILHIRDTLLTPAERKSKNVINLWNKAVSFVEEHESRVKAELVNIDGEDFRAWKWIGSRKL